MLLSQYYLKDGAARLKNLEKQMKTGSDLDQIKTRYYGIVIDMIFAAEEIHFCTGNMEYAEMKNAIGRTMSTVKSAEDIAAIKEITNTLLNNYFYEARDYGSDTINSFRSAVNQCITKYTPLLNDNLSAIAQCIDAPTRSINILDPRCRDGQNIAVFKERIPESVLYGIEAETHIAEQAKSRVGHVAMGKLLGSRISNDAFDVMFIEPPISWILATNSLRFSKNEKTFIHDTFKYVRPDGAIIIVLPYFRLYKDMCVMFSKYLDNIQVKRLADKDFYDKGLVAIIGTRSLKKEPNEETYRYLRKLHNPDKIENVFAGDLNKIKIAQDAIPIEVFRGSILDMDEMDNIVRTSGCMDAFWDNQDVEKIHENIKQPLLPFNIGQIGLVLTSGCLDGIVDEGDGNYHIIKGRVSKKSSLERDVDSSGTNIEVNETISNRVEINVIMPNGEYKVLA